LREPKKYFVYIMASRSLNFYVGLSSKLRQRVFQHKNGMFKGFTSRYRVDRLVYWESYQDVAKAIDRERQLKRWTRAKKIELIKTTNPTWQDLSEGWFDKEPGLTSLPLTDRPKSTADPSTRTGNATPAHAKTACAGDPGDTSRPPLRLRSGLGCASAKPTADPSTRPALSAKGLGSLRMTTLGVQVKSPAFLRGFSCLNG
jgi:putative endonuclease